MTFEAADNWRAALWQRVTENVIDTAAGNLAAYVATPLLHEIDLALPNCASPVAARDAFLDFVWERGGGLPVPPPLALGGERERLQLPPGLRERVVAVDDASVTYRVDNPGWLTYPVSHHRGRVSFTQAGGEGVRLRWLVAVRPLPGAAPLVKGFTRTIVNTLALNLRAHLDGDDDVSLRGPRGAGGEWGAIAADTWLGRVLKVWLEREFALSFAHWRKDCLVERTEEFQAAVLEVQRVSRGYVGRCRMMHRRRLVGARALQSVFRGKKGRRKAANRRQYLLEKRSVATIEDRWIKLQFRREANRIVAEKRRQRAATKIECAARQRFARASAVRARRRRDERVAATQIQARTPRRGRARGARSRGRS